VQYVWATDAETLRAFRALTETEGILPALESAHAIAHLWNRKKKTKKDIVIVNLSGRGDKDVQVVARAIEENHE
jgi:tryptophan synthase beta chain